MLRGAGTPLEAEIADGFERLSEELAIPSLSPHSTVDDDNNPPVRQRVRHTISAAGPIVRDKVFWASTFEALRNDQSSAFTDGLQQTDQFLFTGKVNWTVSNKDTLEISAKKRGVAGVKSSREFTIR